ncbi:MAG: FmdB family zinc ribbon protein [Coriobacteriia bacterium]
MPSYDFRCTVCDETFEIVRRAADRADVTCPKCSSPAKRVFTPVGVHFKGSGFHSTDYRSRPKDETVSAPACPAAKEGPSACADCPSAKN